MTEAKTADDFLNLLEKCRIQVEADPEAFTNNPQLWDFLWSIWLRLCGGDVIENAVGRIHGPETRR